MSKGLATHTERGTGNLHIVHKTVFDYQCPDRIPALGSDFERRFKGLEHDQPECNGIVGGLHELEGGYLE